MAPGSFYFKQTIRLIKLKWDSYDKYFSRNKEYNGKALSYLGYTYILETTDVVHILGS